MSAIINDIVSTLAQTEEMAQSAKLSVDQLAKAAKVFFEAQERVNASRRSSAEDRAAIDACIRALDGELKDISASDILVRANVPKKAGTVGYASRQKRLLLTHRKE